MSYVQTIAQFKIFDTIITGDLYPIVLFDIPIPYITEIQINKDTNDKNEYIVTLYTKQFKLNLDRKTFIHNRLEIKEYRDVFEKVTQINLHDTLFLYGRVRLKQKMILLMKKCLIMSLKTLLKIVISTLIHTKIFTTMMTTVTYH